MAKTKDIQKADNSSEGKIKEAARTVFIRKGYAATRTRDIAEEAGINLALLNYYFRSKAKLFEIIMMETLTSFVHGLVQVLNNEKTTFEDKIQEIAFRYIDLIIEEPEIPTFIVSEIRNNPAELIKKIPVKEFMAKSIFFRQHQELVAAGKISEPNPLHFLVNMMGLIVFPFIAKPLLMGNVNLQTPEFNKLMLERKRLIPIWMQAIMTAG